MAASFTSIAANFRLCANLPAINQGQQIQQTLQQLVDRMVRMEEMMQRGFTLQETLSVI